MVNDNGGAQVHGAVNGHRDVNVDGTLSTERVRLLIHRGFARGGPLPYAEGLPRGGGLLPGLGASR